MCLFRLPKKEIPVGCSAGGKLGLLSGCRRTICFLSSVYFSDELLCRSPDRSGSVGIESAFESKQRDLGQRTEKGAERNHGQKNTPDTGTDPGTEFWRFVPPEIYPEHSHCFRESVRLFRSDTPICPAAGNLILYISGHGLCDRCLPGGRPGGTEFRKVHALCELLSTAPAGADQSV